jgi:hypothetical protein
MYFVYDIDQSAPSDKPHKQLLFVTDHPTPTRNHHLIFLGPLLLS